ncbi:RHS repeat-associated core domain-containing protein [Marinobacterium stanieri]|uniref:RHS repeat-associated core domain-containing protein n=1 Tax=Marinobacterium stanieri TaxID=49186 RepID=A0A1N6XIE0_9GAMM|nr:RHS repeat-associated core domain-containing protein [Marinobacterium stanieri]SIR02094.1 RHS repeat-associated core domain-containing protein [Marinobacterium stanieri]
MAQKRDKSTQETVGWYDANGNVLSKGGLSFSYDRYNSLTSVSGTVSATYTYNAHRQRTSKTVNGQTTYYLYNQSGQLLAELDHSGQTKVEYVWLGTQPLAVIHSGPASAVVYYIHTDHLNTPQVVSDNQGTVVWRADYDAFGQAAVAPGSILTFNLRFPGQYFDSETGLHYNYYRDYDPSTGRYIQSDPIGLDGGLNTYGYVENNPLIYSDPFGLLRWRGTATSVGVVGGVGATATRYQMTSDWVDGKRATVTAIGVGPALGVNAKHVVHAVSVFETSAVDFRYCNEGAVCCSD